MSTQLETPFIHRIIESPIGRLFHSRLFERFKISSVDREFTVLRARAAADVAGTDVETFLDELGAPEDVDRSIRSKIEDALVNHSEARAEYETATEAWDDAFWESTTDSVETRNALEERRREAGGNWVSPQRTFKFLSSVDWIDIVDFDVPNPADTVNEWSERKADSVYGPPTAEPPIETSATMRGPGTREYLLRFDSPSQFVDDVAYARVYEPWDTDLETPLSTLVFGTGLAMACDVMDYWTEEAYVGRALATEGYRIVLPIPPWHGRREILGWYTGEPYLARMPVSAIELYEAQAKEIAVLNEWARSVGAPRVGVGGISMGGIVSMFIAGFSDEWPAAMRPDFAVPVAASADVAELLFESSLTEILGVTGALEAAGWTPETMRRLDHLLTTPAHPGIDPAECYPVGGLVDDMTKYVTLQETLDGWGVPQDNRLEWECGHFGVTLRAMRTDEFQTFVRAALDG